MRRGREKDLLQQNLPRRQRWGFFLFVHWEPIVGVPCFEATGHSHVSPAHGSVVPNHIRPDTPGMDSPVPPRGVFRFAAACVRPGRAADADTMLGSTWPAPRRGLALSAIERLQATEPAEDEALH